MLRLKSKYGLMLLVGLLLVLLLSCSKNENKGGLIGIGNNKIVWKMVSYISTNEADTKSYPDTLSLDFDNDEITETIIYNQYMYQMDNKKVRHYYEFVDVIDPCGTVKIHNTKGKIYYCPANDLTVTTNSDSVYMDGEFYGTISYSGNTRTLTSSDGFINVSTKVDTSIINGALQDCAVVDFVL